MLLYRQERAQHDITMEKHPGKSASEIYGAEHLLRVFGEITLRRNTEAMNPSKGLWRSRLLLGLHVNPPGSVLLHLPGFVLR